MAMSFIGGKGLSTTQLLNLVVNSLYDQFVEKDIKEFDGFNVGILDTFNTINMALPGKHYIVPSYKDVKDLFEQWKETNKEDKKKMLSEFINEKVNVNKADESMLITAIVAPPAAMMAKKTGQIVPQLALMNAIPDVVFVPSATLLALIAIKIIRLTFIGNKSSKDIKRSHVQPTPKPTQIEESKKSSPPPEPTPMPSPPPEPTPIKEPITPSPPPEPTPMPSPPPETTPIKEPITPSPPPEATPMPSPPPETTPIKEPITPSPPPDPTPMPSPPPEKKPQTKPQTIVTEQDVVKYKHLLGHKHTGNSICPLCAEIIAKAMEEEEEARSNAIPPKT